MTITEPRSLGRGGVLGAVAGLAGGLVQGGIASVSGQLPGVAALVRSGSAVVGFALDLLVAAVIGSLFGMAVARRRAGTGDTLFWGLLYGGFWWFLGPLTLQPLLSGQPVSWNLAQAQALLPGLFGHLYYGAVTAVVFVVLHAPRRRPRGPAPATLVRGAVAGLVVAAILYSGLDLMAQMRIGWIFLVGPIVGIGYAVLYDDRQEGAGPSLIRGTAYGFGWWIVLELTVAPMLAGRRPDFSRAGVTQVVDRLPEYLLLGAGIGLVFTVLGGLGRWLFVDDIRIARTETAGTRGLLATGYGAVAGLAGGAVFTVVMVLVGELPTIARLIGGHAAAAGLIVHLIIAQAIGVSYAMLFRRRSFDLVSGLEWGVSYGFLWWVLGDLTLLPVLVGGSPAFSAAAIAAEFPSLVGHLGYGAALGAVYYRLELRADPWWSTRSEVEATRVAGRRAQTQGSAPALCGLTVLIALLMPLLLGG